MHVCACVRVRMRFHEHVYCNVTRPPYAKLKVGTIVNYAGPAGDAATTVPYGEAAGCVTTCAVTETLEGAGWAVSLRTRYYIACMLTRVIPI